MLMSVSVPTRPMVTVTAVVPQALLNMASGAPGYVLRIAPTQFAPYQLATASTEFGRLQHDCLLAAPREILVGCGPTDLHCRARINRQSESRRIEAERRNTDRGRACSGGSERHQTGKGSPPSPARCVSSWPAYAHRRRSSIGRFVWHKLTSPTPGLARVRCRRSWSALRDR